MSGLSSEMQVIVIVASVITALQGCIFFTLCGLLKRMTAFERWLEMIIWERKKEAGSGD
jgi:hypothetical protein